MCLCECVWGLERSRNDSSLQWEVNMRGDQKEVVWADICTVTEQADCWMASLFSSDPSSYPLMSSASTLYLHLKWLLWGCPLPLADWRVLSFDLQVNTDLQASLVFGIRRLMSACQSKPEMQLPWRVDFRVVVWLERCCIPRGGLIKTKTPCDLLAASPPPTTYDLTQLDPITSLITPLLAPASCRYWSYL